MEAGGWTVGVLGFCVRVVISLINRSRETTKTQRRDTTKRHNEAVSWLEKNQRNRGSV